MGDSKQDCTKGVGITVVSEGMGARKEMHTRYGEPFTSDGVIILQDWWNTPLPHWYCYSTLHTDIFTALINTLTSQYRSHVKASVKDNKTDQLVLNVSPVAMFITLWHLIGTGSVFNLVFHNFNT